MAWALRWQVLLTAAFVISAGSLLHFAWEWSGRNSFVAVFAAINESTWEHLKLAFWPAFLVALLQLKFYAKAPGFLLTTAVRCALPALLIILLFYGYTWLLGRHCLIADLLVFAVSILAGSFSVTCCFNAILVN